MSMQDTIYVIVGPTAVGKTALAIQIAKIIQSEIISADSMQIYKEMNIGTAKPTLEEQQGIKHHMIDFLSPNTEYSVALYQKQAMHCIQTLLKQGATPILAGGTGLYINSITHDLDFAPKPQDTQLREQLNRMSKDELYAKLMELDPEAANRTHPNNKKRVIRAIEINKLGEAHDDYDINRYNDAFNFTIVGLTQERKKLYESINCRVDSMLEKGLLEEAEKLFALYGDSIPALQGIGYKEFMPYFRGDYSLDEAIRLVKRNTRRFAKRQFTWFKRDKRIVWYDIDKHADFKQLARKITSNDKL